MSLLTSQIIIFSNVHAILANFMISLANRNFYVASQVYINTSNVDDYLVESITMPAADPNAGEVYYRCIYESNVLLLNKTSTLVSKLYFKNISLLTISNYICKTSPIDAGANA